MRKSFLLFILPLVLYSQEPSRSSHKSPEQIELEIDQAEADFKKAKKMFNPWYTGPLVTPTVEMVAPGSVNIQPYLFVIDNYAEFNEDRHSISQPNLINLNSLVTIQTGITDTMDITVNLEGDASWERGKSGGGFSDITVMLGFPICLETPYVPQIKVNIQESFPTGRYERLSSNGLNLSSTGTGAYQTTFSLGTSKILFWSYKHPMCIRTFVGYTLSPKVKVSGFNTYGGGFGTKGKVHPGNIFAADLGIEYSITQTWVAALDIVYTATNRSKFHGIPGTDSSGSPATVGTGYSDNLSLAPAIEYNWNDNLGVIGGVQFSVYGRNSENFVSTIFSFSYTYPN